MKSKKATEKKAKASPCATLAGEVRLPLTGFKGAAVPDVSAIKFVYSDYRVITAAVNQAEYVYRLNSLFDPDQSGVGGQPDGFDQWKLLYDIYRVVAVEVKVEAQGNGANTNGLLAVAPTDTAGGFNSAEEVAGLRKGKGMIFSQTDMAKIHARWHIGELFGRSDVAILGDQECAALVSANPAAQQYLTIGIETGNSATGQTMVWVEITYYARLEKPTAVLDTVSRRRRDFLLGRDPGPSKVTAVPDVAEQTTVSGRGVQSAPAPTASTTKLLRELSGTLARIESSALPSDSARVAARK